MNPRLLRLDVNDLDQYATPVVVEFWRLWRPREPRAWRADGDYRGVPLQPLLDDAIRDAFAELSDMEARAILISPTIDLGKLGQRFPWARPRTVAGVLRLLVLHECAHFALGHNGLRTALDHRGDNASLRAKAGAMEAEADGLTRRWWREGLTRANVPTSRGIAFRDLEGDVLRMSRAEADGRGFRPGDVLTQRGGVMRRASRAEVEASERRRLEAW